MPLLYALQPAGHRKVLRPNENAEGTRPAQLMPRQLAMDNAETPALSSYKLAVAAAAAAAAAARRGVVLLVGRWAFTDRQ